MIWTDEATKILTSLWLDGVAAKDIAAWVGASSRHAVIGKARRLGLPPHVARPTRKAAPRPRYRTAQPFKAGAGALRAAQERTAQPIEFDPTAPRITLRRFSWEQA